MILRNPIVIEPLSYHTPIKIYDFLECIDQLNTDFLLQNYEKLEDDGTIGDNIYDLFYFKKRMNNTFQYHLFPELNLKLIENEKLMMYTAQHDRNVYIK